MQFLKKNNLWVIVSVTILVSLLFAWWVIEHRSFSPERGLIQIQEDYPEIWDGIRDTLPELVDRGGVEGALAVSHLAFREGSIGVYHCHLVSHLIGHTAVSLSGYDLEKLFFLDDWNLCEFGYVHGIEAQIVLEDGEYLGRIQEFCTILKKQDPFFECFHGSGHAYMNETLDTESALGLCDRVGDRLHIDTSSCYEGVFSELTSLVGGVDSETGIPYPGDPPLVLAVPPMDFCGSLSKESHRIACAYELNGLGVRTDITPEETAERLHDCVNNRYELSLKQACIFSVAAVSAWHELFYRDTVTLAPHMLMLKNELREPYIRAVAQKMWEYTVGGAVKDYDKFCIQLSDELEREACRRIAIAGK